MQIYAKVPGSCGELLQGWIDGHNLLVTCPINVYSKVSVLPLEEKIPPLGKKAAQAASLVLNHLKIKQLNYKLKLESSLPQGKGMASSSADIAAVCQAIAAVFGPPLSADEIADLALKIEPTDGIFYNGIMLFDHITGRIRINLGEPPPIVILIFDIGGAIDTVAFNTRQDLSRLNRLKEHEVKKALQWIRNGLMLSCPEKIGQGATMSAMANQSILYKPYLEEILRCVYSHDGIGITVAHSGTVIGLLFDKNRMTGMRFCLEQMNKDFPEIRYIRTANLISGGVEVVKHDALHI